jgi:hypothetical protein
MTGAPFAGAAARLHVLPDAGEHRYAVILARSAGDAVPAALSRPGTLAAVLTHAPGVRWPDAAGERLAAETLASGGVAALAFADLADALACRARIAERQQ